MRKARNKIGKRMNVKICTHSTTRIKTAMLIKKIITPRNQRSITNTS